VIVETVLQCQEIAVAECNRISWWNDSLRFTSGPFGKGLQTVVRRSMSVTGLQIGDRFEVASYRLPDRLELPLSSGPNGFAIEVIEDDIGRVLRSAIDPSSGAMRLPELGKLVVGQDAILWLEYRRPGRFRLIVEPGTPYPASAEIATEQGVPILFEPRD
jgi:hypothetical protein